MARTVHAEAALKIWVDIVNSPQVSVMRPILRELERRGHEPVITTRDFAQTVPMADQAGLQHRAFGRHGGSSPARVVGYNIERALALAAHMRRVRPALALSHNSYSQAVAAQLLGIPFVTLMDYEHRRANHIAFRLARRVLVPAAFPESALRRFGAHAKSVRYPGLKEELYLADFKPDPNFRTALGVAGSRPLVVARPPADWAGYYKGEGELFRLALQKIQANPTSFLVFLPRVPSQIQLVRDFPSDRLLVPDRPLDGSNLVYWADLVISAGGTMNREAAVLGTPAVTVFEGSIPAVDRELIEQGRLQLIKTAADVEGISIAIRPARPESAPIEHSNLVAFVADAILGAA